MLKVKLFGISQAQYGNCFLDGFPNQRCHLLLCYLLLNRQHPHYRERLAAIFWGDFPSLSARKQLRNALWGLRRALQSVNAQPDKYLLTSDESIALVNSSHLWLDTEIFENAMHSCQDLPGEKITWEQASQLEMAADLYTGDLLAGVYEDWCIYDRERLRLLYLNTLSKLMVFHGVNGNLEQGLGYGQRILAMDNTLERVHRQVMCLEWLSGNRTAALAQYKLCSQILRDELGVVPMDETRELYEQMLHGQGISSEQLLQRFLFSRPQVEIGKITFSPVEQLLQKLQHLQETFEQTSAELSRIERLIHQSLTRL